MNIYNVNTTLGDGLSNHERAKRLARLQGFTDAIGGREANPKARAHSAWEKWYLEGYNADSVIT